MKSRGYFLIILWVLSFASSAWSFQAGDKRLIYESSEKPVPLVELYTSDARSSCNKAVEYFNEFKKRDIKTDLWKKFVPIVMHVSLWDISAYKDAFSKKEFGDRLLAYQKNWGASQVYAPTVAVNGLEWSGWARGQNIPTSTREKAGVLKVDGSVRENMFQVSFTPAKDLEGKTFVVNAALMGFGLRSKPSEGSNRNHSLQHEFVALYLKQAELKVDHGVYVGSVELSKKGLWMKEYAVVFWISEKGKNVAIQSTGGHLPL